ncbi:GNAT family N-acetyltransferase [Paenibacillus mesotrionivorans]|uniref:GNAT family N-acetyltransferase n=1 Tax=Paenibacillus mesotrionivorans TaxID=3160968 RepID=A0ACC7P206_9BACL
MGELYIQECLTVDVDLELLAALNKQLIEDEQHDNKMNLDELKDRMKTFLRTDYKAYFFKEREEIKGYALVNHNRQPIYLRQFFICRDSRRGGYGKLAFQKLKELLNTDEIDIEVMHWNDRGYSFWKTMGFKERSIYLRLDKNEEL